MTTITIKFHNDADKELLKKLLESAEFTDEDIAELDRRMAELEKDPSKGISLESFMSEIKAKYGI